MIASYTLFNKFYGKMSLGFCLNKRKRFFLEVLFYNQQKDVWFYKTVSGIFKIAFRLWDRHIFMWQPLEILNVCNVLTLKQVWKQNLFWKTGVLIF